MTPRKLFMGIDGGGTKTLARLEDASGKLLGEGLSGSGNPAQNSEVALNSILEASATAVEAAGLPREAISDISVHMGLAGVSVPKYAEIAANWELPFRDARITTDLHIASAGAHEGKEGSILITGTGSSAFAEANGEHFILGGHGFPIGDKASGAWLGWKAISYTLEGFDGLQETTALSSAVTKSLGVSSASNIVAMALHYKSRDFATLAPLVIEHARNGDPLGVTIMQEGADYLTRLITRLLEIQPARFSMIGGLAPLWQEWLPNHIQSQIKPALLSPEAGAVRLARNTFL